MLQPFYQKRYIEAGCDEAGRGCYAGPVFAAAVILRKDFHHPYLNDSKQLTETQRNELRPIIEKEAVCYSVAKVDHDEIDKINILRASIKAMHMALDNLKKRPKYILVDGNRFTPYQDVKHKCIIKGDGLYSSIAAASVLAKTYRDEFMRNLHHEHPLYNWNSNKGYGTQEHRLAIEAHGLCKYHRLSFNINPQQIVLNFEEENIVM
ncbi:MAG TPA: ribonuclease HII [Segetibacter sp.]|jgi:ribonuclease HII